MWGCCRIKRRNDKDNYEPILNGKLILKEYLEKIRYIFLLHTIIKKVIKYVINKLFKMYTIILEHLQITFFVYGFFI